MSKPTPRFVSPAPPAVDPGRLDRLNMELALLAVLDADPRWRAMGWPAVVTAYRNATEAVLHAWVEAEDGEKVRTGFFRPTDRSHPCTSETSLLRADHSFSTDGG
jgi:hypothetical protein